MSFLVDGFSRYKVGDRMEVSLDRATFDGAHEFTITKLVRKPKTKDLYLVDEYGEKHPADQCRFVHPEWLITILAVVESIIATDGEDYDLLQSLEPEHKAILWRSLTLDQRKALSEIKARLDQQQK